MRKAVTAVLTEAASHYFIKKLYAVFPEFGVGYKGERRLDLLCMHTKGNLVGVEVKSGKRDYTTDSKWKEYLPYTNKLYLCLPPSLVESKFYKQILEDIKPFGVGVMTLSPLGIVKVVKPAKSREVADEITAKLLLKMAWRGGDSRRNVRPKRRFKLPTE